MIPIELKVALALLLTIIAISLPGAVGMYQEHPRLDKFMLGTAIPSLGVAVWACVIYANNVEIARE